MLVPYFCNQDNWDKFKEELLSWEGTPYRHFQKAKGYGADCTMFIGQAYVNVGILKGLDYEYYSKDWHLHTDNPIVEDSIHRNFNKNVAIPNLSFKKVLNNHLDYVRGDFILIATVKGTLSNHCSVMWDDNEQMIHSINNAGVELTHYVKWWKRHTRYKIRLFQEI
jgi:cell wall-associated NlpC family hydrolase